MAPVCTGTGCDHTYSPNRGRSSSFGDAEEKADRIGRLFLCCFDVCMFLRLCSLLLVPSLSHSQGEWGEAHSLSCCRANVIPAATICPSSPYDWPRDAATKCSLHKGTTLMQILPLCYLHLVAASRSYTCAQDGVDTVQLALVVFFLPPASANTPLAVMVVITRCNLRWWCFSLEH